MQKMNTQDREISDADPKSKKSSSCRCGIVPTVSLLCVILLFTTQFFAQDYNENLLRWRMNFQKLGNDKCKNQCRPSGSEALPEGIISNTSDLEMRSLWNPHMTKTLDKKDNAPTNLFAMAVGIKQKDLVNKMVQKFLASNFVVMLFHYDGIVDQWNEFEWNNHVIHVSVANQSKWWFAKRFLHPDIVAEYGYIFLWDEDLGVENFNPDKYVSIIKDEGLEISQPALDAGKSEVHHQITARGRRTKVHRRTYKPGGRGKGCNRNSTAPPCTGWVEMMAPVFSRAAWRCVWHMIQNDLIHAWGLDYQLGYCAQGDRTKNVGVVDDQYIVHYGHPTLGALDVNEVPSHAKNHRVDVRRLSYRELQIFRNRWQKAVEEDQCWVDPFQ
ncbi:hypothetical protein VNO77_21054 [Canavalia gladiata]|uniref:Uncharacterized protein n=1 Tax=Canavalia gladiata TaxID=3824 RepID=A0AAN9QLY5_CANGL